MGQGNEAAKDLPSLRGPVPILAFEAAYLCKDRVPECDWPIECREAMEWTRQNEDMSGLWYDVFAKAEKRYGLWEAGVYLCTEIERRSQSLEQRINRLKALGNGVVPAVVARFLSQVLTGDKWHS